MTFFSQALIWFLFVCVLGVLLAAIFLSVAAVVKTYCWRGTAPPTETTPTEPVPWITAIEVTNPDDTKIMAVHESPA
jgi:flagellar basal body-associated protein FliL